jgi:hypothetical protein
MFQGGQVHSMFEQSGEFTSMRKKWESLVKGMGIEILPRSAQREEPGRSPPC